MWPPRSRTACRSLPPEGAAAPAGWRSQTRGPGWSGSMPPRSRTACRSRGLAGRGSRDASRLSPVQSCSSSFGAAGSSPSGTAAPAGWRSQTRGYEKSLRGGALRVAPCPPRGPLRLRAGEARPAAPAALDRCPHGRALCVAPEALQAAARKTLRLCRLSKAAQAALEPQAPAPRGPLRLRAGEKVQMQRAHHATGDALLMQRR